MIHTAKREPSRALNDLLKIHTSFFFDWEEDMIFFKTNSSDISVGDASEPVPVAFDLLSVGTPTTRLIISSPGKSK